MKINENKCPNHSLRLRSNLALDSVLLVAYRVLIAELAPALRPIRRRYFHPLPV